jgi:threonine dehydratase
VFGADNVSADQAAPTRRLRCSGHGDRGCVRAKPRTRHPLTVAGAGTLAAEFAEQVPELDTILIAVGGGGLLAGALTALAGSVTQVVGVEPSTARCLGAALEAEEPVDVEVSGDAVDSLGMRRVGRIAFASAVAHRVLRIDVSNEAIRKAQLTAWEELRVGLEGGVAATWILPPCSRPLPTPVDE